jgi:hypothetical protein
MKQHNRPSPQRRQLAYEAARIMAEQGIEEFEPARRKAAERARVDNKRFWPSNEEIHEALLAQRRLFHTERQTRELRRLRERALEAMRTFGQFFPRLVGPVLTGVADGRQGLRLHLFADNPEQVVLLLLDRGIPWEEREATLRFGGGVRRVHPVLAFLAGETRVELVVLPPSAQRNPPLDPVNERPDRGADAAEVERLLGEASAHGASSP